MMKIPAHKVATSRWQSCHVVSENFGPTRRRWFRRRKTQCTVFQPERLSLNLRAKKGILDILETLELQTNLPEGTESAQDRK
jgi:hypothetical protein